MRRVYVFLVMSLAGAPGCYRFHTRDHADGGSSADGGGVVSRDGAVAATLDVVWSSPSDASASIERDVWYPDSSPPLPVEPEPDPGPDGRPSDDPDGWVDPPDVGTEDPCCTLSEPVRLAVRPETVLSDDPPLIAWGADGWGLAVTRYDFTPSDVRSSLDVYDLHADGTPVGPARTLDGPPLLGAELRPDARALRWSAGRWALAAAGDATTGPEREMHVRLFDRVWTPATAWLGLGAAVGVDVAYVSRGNHWLAFTSSTVGVVRTTPVDERAGLGTASESPMGWSRSVAAASFRSRAAVVPISAESAPDFLVVDPEGTELGRVARTGDWDPAGAASALRDLAVVAVRRDTRVEVEVLDPFAVAPVTGRVVLAEAGPIEDGAVEDAVDVAGSSKLGVAGVCWGQTPPDGRRGGEIRFALVGPDGLSRGAPVTIVSSDFRASMVGCTVGTDERGFLVGWWNGSELWVRRVDVAE